MSDDDDYEDNINDNDDELRGQIGHHRACGGGTNSHKIKRNQSHVELWPHSTQPKISRFQTFQNLQFYISTYSPCF